MARSTVATLQERLEQAESHNEILQESLVDAQLALEGRGWERIGSLTGLDEFDKTYLNTAARRCRAAAVINPLIGRAIKLRIAYIWGSGVEITARASQDAGAQDINAVIHAFLDDDLNKAAFTSGQAREENERALAPDGNVFLVLDNIRVRKVLLPGVIHDILERMYGNGSQDAAGGTTVLDAAVVRAFHDHLDDPLPAVTPVTEGSGKDPAGTKELWAEARALAELQHAISARLARITVHADRAQSDADEVRGVDRTATARIVGSHVGFARRCTQHSGRAFVNLSHALVDDMPHTLKALASGVISEYDAHRVVRETSGLTHAERSAVDHGIRGDLGMVAGNRLADLAKEQACQVAPEVIRDRRKQAEQDRRVSLRPAADSMCRLSAFLPLKDGLACMAALRGAASDERSDAQAQGRDPRPRDQVMADTLVERVTGRAHNQDVFGATVDLIMPIDTLLGETPAHVLGYGPVPADLVREWITTGDPTGPKIRRLFTHPGTGDLLGMDSRARRYPGLLARFIIFRDQTCRTPWCGAPIRQIDHIKRHADGGETSERNGQGTCTGCNLVEEHPDYQITGDASHTTTTTGGFTLHSRPPNPPGQPPPTSSHPERFLMDIVWENDVQEQDRRTEHRKRRQEEDDYNGVPDPYNQHGTHGPPDLPDDPEDFI